MFMSNIEKKTQMTIKTSRHIEREKQTTLGPPSSNYNNYYGVFEIDLVGCIWLQPKPT